MSKEKSTDWLVAAIISLFAIVIVLGLVAGINYLVAWGVLACLKGLGVIAAYTGTQIWYATGLLTLVLACFGRPSSKS